MSRTTRHIPLWARLLKARNGVSCVCGRVYVETKEYMSRKAIINGYDGVQQSSVRSDTRGYDRDVYTGASRRFYKQAFHARRRRSDRIYLREWQREYD
jgi:hypothetical protein